MIALTLREQGAKRSTTIPSFPSSSYNKSVDLMYVTAVYL